VTIEFHDVEKLSNTSKIVIRDNGIGMSLTDIRDKWLVVGTASKRKKMSSPPPFNRRYIGEKGVGRFAVDKLGAQLLITTKQKDDSQLLNVQIKWDEYKEKENTGQITLFTDMSNEYYYTDVESYKKDQHEFKQGTELIITNLHETWDLNRITRLVNQLGRIISPSHKLNPPFDIYFNAPSFDINNELVKPKPLEKFATINESISYNNKFDQQETLKFNRKTLSFDKELVPKLTFGPVDIELYYFDQQAQKDFKKHYKHQDNYIEGVKIYRDGVVCTPFAEYESNVDKRRDVLGIDKRRWKEAFDKLSTREIIGIVNITKENNSYIIDATNRQDFVDNEQYRDLKDFIIKQIDELSEYKKAQRIIKKKKVQNNLKKASSEIRQVSKLLKQFANIHPELAKEFAPLLSATERVIVSVEEGAKQSEESEKEYTRKENIYLSLMSLQDYAANLAHAIRLSLGKVKRAAEYFKDEYPNPNLEHRFKHYAVLIYDEMDRMSQVVDFMLSYAQIDIDTSEFTVKDMLDELLLKAYRSTFEFEDIDISVNCLDNVLFTMNRKFVEDVLTNLVGNSIKALKGQKDKKIVCESYVSDSTLFIDFSDNGVGIKRGDEGKVFDIYYTTTAEQGGAGLGLFVAKTRMNSLNGDIVVAPSLFAPKGATFRLSLPLNNSDRT